MADKTITKVGDAIRKNLEELSALGKKELLEARYDKYRVIGEFETLASK